MTASFPAATPSATPVNVAARLTSMAEAMPDAVAVVQALRRRGPRRRRYRQLTFRELDDDSNRVAQGLIDLGVRPAARLALLVRPGIDFVSLVFALYKCGAVAILIDPGMGRRNMVRCLAETEPDGFVAIPQAQAVRTLLFRRFPKSRFNVTVGPPWFWGGPTLRQLRNTPCQVPPLVQTDAEDPAAIIFTSGSTGPPKGVLYRHGNFDAQVEQIRDHYRIQPGEIDVPCFPLFGLFNCAMGVTAVIPDMDASRPARVDPRNLVEAARDWSATQAFGSPAVWNVVGPYCARKQKRIDTLRRVLSAGAPVPAEVLRRMKECIHPEGQLHTPYGATEALPVASIEAAEVLGETAEKTRQGGGVCVGRRFPGIAWMVVRATEGPLANLAEAEPLPAGEIGELIVSGPQVTREYLNRPEANRLGKIRDGQTVWHRMGDLGYLDEKERFWFCGRMAHRVHTADGPMDTIPCEAIFNQHEEVFRTALVGVGPQGSQRPVLIVEPLAGHMPSTAAGCDALLAEVRDLGRFHPLTSRIHTYLLHRSFPVDVRHNSKIFREKLAVWAARQLGPLGRP